MAGAVAKRRIASIASLPLERVGRPKSFVRGIPVALREVWQRRELVLLLSRREVRARYKDSSLGLMWSLARPLAQLAVYYFAIGKVLGVERSIPQFAIFVFIGLTGWTFYTELIQRATTSITSNGGLVKKVYLPREVFPLASAGSALFTFAVQFLVLLVAMLLVRQMPAPADLGYAALGFSVLAVLALAVGLALAALNVYLRDVEHLIEVLFVVMFWASPIVYSFSFVHKALSGNWIETAYLSNPATIAILGLQRGLWTAGNADPTKGVYPENLTLLLVIALLASLVLLVLAQALFARLQGNFAQEV
jgi:ABC-2 type transport system permease protein